MSISKGYVVTSIELNIPVTKNDTITKNKKNAWEQKNIYNVCLQLDS